jgi:hypothetical protein
VASRVGGRGLTGASAAVVSIRPGNPGRDGGRPDRGLPPKPRTRVPRCPESEPPRMRGALGGERARHRGTAVRDRAGADG